MCSSRGSPLPDVRTDAESLRLADAFQRLERVEEFQQYRAELTRESAFVVDQLVFGRAESYDRYLELRGTWLGLQIALGLPGVVVEEAVDIKRVEVPEDDVD